MIEIDAYKILAIQKRSDTKAAIAALCQEIGSRMVLGGGFAHDGQRYQFADDIMYAIINVRSETCTGFHGVLWSYGKSIPEARDDLLHRFLEPSLNIPGFVTLKPDQEVCLMVGDANRPKFVRVKPTSPGPTDKIL